MGLSNYVSTYQSDFSGSNRLSNRHRSRSTSSLHKPGTGRVPTSGRPMSNQGFFGWQKPQKQYRGGVTVDGRGISSAGGLPTYKQPPKQADLFSSTTTNVTVDGRGIGNSKPFKPVFTEYKPDLANTKYQPSFGVTIDGRPALEKRSRSSSALSQPYERPGSVFGRGLSEYKPSFGVTIDGRQTKNKLGSSKPFERPGSLFGRGHSEFKPSPGVTIDGRPAGGRRRSTSFGSAKQHTGSVFGRGRPSATINGFKFPNSKSTHNLSTYNQSYRGSTNTGRPATSVRPRSYSTSSPKEFSSTTTFVPVYGQGISKLNSFKPVDKPSFGVTIDGRPATGLRRSSSVGGLSTPVQFGTGSMFSRGLSECQPSFGVTIDGRPAVGKGQSISFGSSKPFENTSSFFGVYPVRGSEYKPNINAQSFGVTIDGRPAMGKGQSNSFGRPAMGYGQFNSFGSSKPFENTSSFFGKTGYKPSPFKFTSHHLSQSGLDKYSNEMSRYNET